MALKSTYDRAQDILHIKKEGAQLLNSTECDDDCNLIFNFDRFGKISGLQILCAGDLVENPHYVDDYPVSDEFKEAIRQKLNLETPLS